MIDISSFLIFSVVVSLMVLSPGPNGLLIVKNVPINGLKAGYFNVAGIAMAFFIHGTLTIFGLSIIILQSPTLYWWIKLAGGSYLIYLGIKAFIKLRHQKINTEVQEDASYPTEKTVEKKRFQSLIWISEGLLTNLLNPKVSLFYIAAFPQFIPADTTSLMGAYVLICTHATIAVFWFGFLSFMVHHSLERFKQNAAFQKAINLLTGTLLTGLGINVLLVR